MTDESTAADERLYISDGDLDLYVGNALDVLRRLPDESVDCVVTSPPYWGLRSYEGVVPSVWTDPGECEHEWGEPVAVNATTYRSTSKWQHVVNGRGERNEGAAERTEYEGWRRMVVEKGCYCERGCGAWLGFLGLEPTPEQFIANIVELFREVRRVLAPYGTLWLNLGDGYASSGGHTGPGASSQRQGRANVEQQNRGTYSSVVSGLKAKDLIMMPARVALALQADGWWVRMDNVWSKPNPMPESVDDRPTKSHEYVFLLTKSGKPLYWTHPFRGELSPTKPEPEYWWFPPAGVPAEPVADEVVLELERADKESGGWTRRNVWQGHDYYYDKEAVREPHTSTRWGGATITQPPTSKYAKARAEGRSPEGDIAYGGAAAALSRPGREWDAYPEGGRNMRSVWDVPTQPFPDAHFATFPEEIPRRAILAGCPQEVCTACGKPRERVVRAGRGDAYEGEARDTGRPDGAERRNPRGGQKEWDSYVPPVSAGWTECRCGAPYRRGVVLDPFLGSGTVALVARKFSRHAVGIELSPKYAELAAERTKQLSLLA